VWKELQGTHAEHKNKPSKNETKNCTNSVVALHDHGSYKAPTTNHFQEKRLSERLSAINPHGSFAVGGV